MFRLPIKFGTYKKTFEHFVLLLVINFNYWWVTLTVRATAKLNVTLFIDFVLIRAF